MVAGLIACPFRSDFLFLVSLKLVVYCSTQQSLLILVSLERWRSTPHRIALPAAQLHAASSLAGQATLSRKLKLVVLGSAPPNQMSRMRRTFPFALLESAGGR